MKILLTGINGQVAFELQRSLSILGDVIAVGHTDCNLANESAIRQLIRQVEPDVIVNPAAYTAVDKAESDIAMAQAVNVRAVEVIGEEAERIGSIVVHFSTDYVFDGRKSGAYSEKDETSPLSVYGRTKRDGELALQKSGAKHLIFRTSWVAGVHGGNFAKTILRLAAERESLSVVSDQVGVPTSAALLADVTTMLLRQAHRETITSFPFGLYHLTPSGSTNWYDYAYFILEEAHRGGRLLTLKPEGLKAIKAAEYPTLALRPANSMLDTTRFQQEFGLKLPPWQLGVKQLIAQLR